MQQTENEMEERGCALYPVKIFEGEVSQQNTEDFAEGWCETVPREMQRRVRVSCWGGADPVPVRSTRKSAAHDAEINEGLGGWRMDVLGSGSRVSPARLVLGCAILILLFIFFVTAGMYHKDNAQTVSSLSVLLDAP